MKYRKKPVVVEAYKTDKEVIIHTLEGDMKASIGDYIITGINGEEYPCKPDIFEKTYEVVKPPEKMTNYEYIRDMSVEEMARWLAMQIDNYRALDEVKEICRNAIDVKTVESVIWIEAFKQWLEREVSE